MLIPENIYVDNLSLPYFMLISLFLQLTISYADISLNYILC